MIAFFSFHISEGMVYYFSGQQTVRESILLASFYGVFQVCILESRVAFNTAPGCHLQGAALWLSVQQVHEARDFMSPKHNTVIRDLTIPAPLTTPSVSSELMVPLRITSITVALFVFGSRIEDN